MRSNSIPFVLASLIVLVACHDASAPVKPVAIKLVAGDAQIGTVGEALGTVPTFEVYDAGGTPLSGVKLTVAVKDGDGHLASVPPTGWEKRPGPGRVMP